MTWFEGLPEGANDWDRMVAAHPEPMVAMAGVYAAAWADCDPVLVELARLRLAALLGNQGELSHRSAAATAAGLTEEKVAELASWPTSPHFSPTERACLALAEQFAMDATGVTDGHVGAVAAHLGDVGCYAYVEGLSAIETFQRACLTLGIRTFPGVDQMVAAGARYNATVETAVPTTETSE
ncbi:MAG: carboxymuconolactone decarboxylase family protein [Actinomycetota bacterium]|nr:carboxymuconolactone decarboxylase family protein [Actinomycetota bacterium]